MIRKIWKTLVPAFVTTILLGLVGCGGGPDFVMRRNFVEFTPEQQQRLLADNDRAYRIQAGDILKIAFLYLKDLNQETVLVLPDGSVSLVGIDQAKLAGMTVLEADSLLTQAYAKEYRSPNLSVIVIETQGRRIYVAGEVKSPGLFEVPRGGLGIMNAVATAGGFTDHAAKDGVVLVRVTPQGYMCQEVNLDDFHKVQFNELALLNLDGYDIVYVPRSKIGDFGYFSRTVLGGVTNVMRIAADVKYIQSGTRY